MNRNVKLFLVGLGLFIVLPLALWGIISLLALNHAGKVSVDITVVPSDATVQVDNTSFTNKKSVYLKPGNYTVTVSKDGFESTTQEITVSEDTTAHIIAALYPVSSDATAWYNEHQDDYYELEGIAGTAANETGQEFINKYPITGSLPIQKATYLIGYKKTDDQKNIIITITAYEGYRESALQEIRNLGFDPSNYTIEFNNYENPFNE